MKHLKYFEQPSENDHTQPQNGDYVIAYKPYTTEDKNNNIPPTKINYCNYTIEIGKILNHTPDYYNINFLKANKTYIRPKNYILFHSPNLSDTKNYLQTLIDTNKYNI